MQGNEFVRLYRMGSTWDSRSALEGTRAQCLAVDAVQLGSALAARAVDPSCVQFACFDEELRDAAARCGFGLITG